MYGFWIFYFSSMFLEICFPLYFCKTLGYFEQLYTCILCLLAIAVGEIGPD